MKRLLSSSLKFASGTVLSLALQALAIKLYAVLLGPAGIGSLGIVRQTVSLGIQVATLNSQPAVIQGLAKASIGRRQHFVANSVVVLATATIVSACALLIAGPWIEPLAFGIKEAPSIAFAGLAILPIAASAAHIYLSGILIAAERSGAAAIVPVAGAIAFLIAAYPAALAINAGHLVAYYGSFIAGSSVSLLCAIALLGRSLRAELFADLRLEHLEFDEVRKFFGSASALLVTSAVSGVILLVARLILAQQEGLATVGLFEAGWLLSGLFSSIATSALLASQLPRLSLAKGPTEVCAIIDSGLYIALLIAVPSIVILTVAKPFVMRALFDDSFVPALAMWRWMLVGDFLRIVAWTLMLPLLALQQRRAYLTLEISASIVLLTGFAAALGSSHPLQGMGISYLVMTCAYLCVAALLVFPKLSLFPRKQTLGLALAGLFTVTGFGTVTWDSSVMEPMLLVIAILVSITFGAITVVTLRVTHGALQSGSVRS